MKSRSLRAPTAIGAATVLAGFVVAQIVVGPPVVLPIAGATLTPWFYNESDGRLIWDRHRYYEDQANTVFTISRELVGGLAGQVGPYPDVLLCNQAQFTPPEGAPADPGKRRIHKDSVRQKGLQLFVNYGDARIEPSNPSSKLYKKGTFFVALDDPINDQTDPPVFQAGLSSEKISATRAAFGNVGAQLAPHEILIGNPSAAPIGMVVAPVAGTPLSAVTPSGAPVNALYVTASVIYAKNDFDPADQGLVDEAWEDRLMIKDPTSGQWMNESWRVPDSARLGNSSGVAFADFNGDGRMDLYVGKCGDRYAGATNVLCLYNAATGTFVDVTATNSPQEPISATNEVAAADLDLDGDLDIVVANRCRMNGTCGSESFDYYLINNGSGVFTLTYLNQFATDSRSVAIGNIDKVGSPEIVIGNAGADGFANNPDISGLPQHRMQIFVNQSAPPALSFQDKAIPDYFGTTDWEDKFTHPYTQQVLLVDLYSNNSLTPPQLWQPDGWLDLVIVNHRDALKSQRLVPEDEDPSNVYVVMNRGPATQLPSQFFGYNEASPQWVKTVAVADFIKETDGRLDLFAGAGNRFSGAQSKLVQNFPANGIGEWYLLDQSYDLLPGTEHGYGFDFGDIDGNGILDALQTSRTYDYLVRDILTVNGHYLNPHLDFTDPDLSPDQTSNKRGRLVPQGMEDGVFADFNGDGSLDALLASQTYGSSTVPPGGFPNSDSAETIVLEGHFGNQFLHDATSTQLTTNDGTTEYAKIDNKIDINGRKTYPFPGIADRVVAGDLDCDGDVDAIVKLFEIANGHTYTPVLTLTEGFWAPVAQYSAGWRYLENVYSASNPNGFWFKDVAPSKMKNVSNRFATTWNRGLGMTTLADFDNNGALDVYDTTLAGFALNMTPLPPANFKVYETYDQGKDLIFMNKWGTAGFGALTELSAQLLPQLLPGQSPGGKADIVVDPKGDVLFDTAGSFGLAHGDINNDGYEDVLVTHMSFTGRTNFPSLLVNQFAQATPGFTDEWLARAKPENFSSAVIHTTQAKDIAGNPVFPGKTMDWAYFPVMFDYDGDGDVDIIYQVRNDVPRVLRNLGKDNNNDDVIDAADNSQLGEFADVTDLVLGQLKPSSDSQDMAAVDVDDDGDLDLASDPFDDMVTFWRNDRPLGDRPRVAEIWPRVGSIQGTWIELHGANLDNVIEVKLRYANSVVLSLTGSAIQNVSTTRAKVQIPLTAPIGLAQVCVLRSFTSGSATVQKWSHQYEGYFVLDKP